MLALLLKFLVLVVAIIVEIFKGFLKVLATFAKKLESNA